MVLKCLKLCERNYLVIFFLNKFSCVTEQGTAQKGVFPYGRRKYSDAAHC